MSMNVLDVAHPMLDAGRDEVLLVTFDGFIKNTCEGLIRTMLRDSDDWLEKYPNLEAYAPFDQDVLYENSMIFTPMDLLYMLSDGNLSDEELESDLNEILPVILLENSKITSFEFALYTMMKKTFVKKVYLYRETTFFENEFDYVEREFDEVIDKIDWICGGILSVMEEIKPTTIFVADYEVVKAMRDLNQPNWDELMVLLLNTNRNMEYHEEGNQLSYTEEFLQLLKHINSNCTFGLAPMYNRPLEIDEENEKEDEHE